MTTHKKMTTEENMTTERKSVVEYSHVVYAIYDKATGTYGLPVFSLTPAMAARSFERYVLNPESPANSHPKDFTFEHIGNYSEKTGAMLPYITQEPSLSASAVLLRHE